MKDEMENENEGFVFPLSPNYNPRIIHVKSAPTTKCHFNPNSRYQLSPPPKHIIDSLNSLQDETISDNEHDKIDGINNKEEEIMHFQNKYKTNKFSNSIPQKPSQRILPAKSEAAIKEIPKRATGRNASKNDSSKDNSENVEGNENYDPSKVFLSWINQGTTSRPSTNSTKIRLSYSGNSLCDPEKRNSITAISSYGNKSSSDTSQLFGYDKHDDVPPSFRKSPSLTSTHNLTSSISARLNTIFHRSGAGRRYSRYLFSNQDSIPLVEVKGDHVDNIPKTERYRKISESELV